MSTKTSSSKAEKPEYALFTTTRQRRDTQMPDASPDIAARRMIERAWAEERGMDVTRLMLENIATTCPTEVGVLSDKIKTDDPSTDPLQDNPNTF